ncbi:LysR family transcriptional regulator [Falsiroseomonas tokyonensis]|uniref:LysR family transcriptional regulator n=1 Tax=Falsiroseomonas tokyonensis TaxID=430521 RepID=A0ABV7C099_9PROT|nr:LysR family transcriptional regulator [Falsiroseomonas tokyonensis]MBU8541309.1 LysR family transcriptional regulator [Falsiroseomonas tokyonensis]
MISNPPFDLLDLRLVQRVAQAGSLSAAAAALGMTPAAASRRLTVLEARLGQRLFARTTRRLRATAEGEAFLPHVERILAATAEAEAALPGGSGALSGTLRLTAPATFGRKVLAPVMAELLAAHPGLRLDLLLTDTVLDLVASGRDAAVRIAPLSGQTLTARRLAYNRRLLCAAPSWLARHGVPADRAALLRQDALLLEGVDGWVLVPPRGGPPERVRPVPRMVSNSNEALREACLAGLGIGLHSTWDVGEHLRRGELVALPAALGLPEQLGIWLVFPGGTAPPARVRALTELLVRRLGPVPPWDA